MNTTVNGKWGCAEVANNITKTSESASQIATSTPFWLLMEYWWCLEMEGERRCNIVSTLQYHDKCVAQCSHIFFYNMLSYPCWLQLTVTISFLLRQLSRVTSPWPQLSKLFQPHYTALYALILRVCCNSTPSVHACAHLKWHHGTPECVTHHIMRSR